MLVAAGRGCRARFRPRGRWPTDGRTRRPARPPPKSASVPSTSPLDLVQHRARAPRDAAAGPPPRGRRAPPLRRRRASPAMRECRSVRRRPPGTGHTWPGALRTRAAHFPTASQGRRRRPTLRTGRRRANQSSRFADCVIVSPPFPAVSAATPGPRSAASISRCLRRSQGRRRSVRWSSPGSTTGLITARWSADSCARAPLNSIRSNAESTSSGPARSATSRCPGCRTRFETVALRRSSMIMFRATVNSQARADRSTVGNFWVPPSPQQRLLHHILSSCLITGKPHGVAPQSCSVLVVEHPHHGGLRVVHSHLPR